MKARICPAIRDELIFEVPEDEKQHVTETVGSYQI